MATRAPVTFYLHAHARVLYVLYTNMKMPDLLARQPRALFSSRSYSRDAEDSPVPERQAGLTRGVVRESFNSHPFQLTIFEAPLTSVTGGAAI